MPVWIIYALLAAVFAAAVAILGKIGLEGVDTTLATTVRAMIMAGFLVVVSLFLGKSSLLGGITSKPLLFIAASGIAGALSWLFYFSALKHGPASGVAALDRLRRFRFSASYPLFRRASYLEIRSGSSACRRRGNPHEHQIN